MNSGSTQTSFAAFAAGDLVVVRVEGPGTCRDSGRFETLLLEVEKRALRTLVVDLSECSRIDSTFAGAFLRLAHRASLREGDRPMQVVLAGARDHVAHLLDTLCLTEVFGSVPMPEVTDLAPLAIEGREMGRDEILALSVDGHERLAAMNEANARKFAMLLPMLREELAKAEAEAGTEGSNGVH